MKITRKKIKKLLKDFFARNTVPSSESEELSDLVRCFYLFLLIPGLEIINIMSAFGAIDEHYSSIVKDRAHCIYTDPVCNARIDEQAAFVGLIFGYSTFCLSTIVKWLNYLNQVSDKTEKNTLIFLDEFKDITNNALFFKKTINAVYSDLAVPNAEGMVIVSDNYYWQVSAASLILGVIANDRSRAFLGGKLYSACTYLGFSKYKYFDAMANLTRGFFDFIFVGFKAFNIMRPLILNLQFAFDMENINTKTSKNIRYIGGAVYALPFAIYASIYAYASERMSAKFEKLLYITLGVFGVAFFLFDLAGKVTNFDKLLLAGLLLLNLVVRYIGSRSLCNNSANCFAILDDDEKLLAPAENLTDPEKALKASAEADAKLDTSIYEMTNTQFGFWRGASSFVKPPKQAAGIYQELTAKLPNESYILRKP